MIGIILSIPNIFYQFWRFISPALKKTEKKYIFAIVIFSSICFLSGISFAYFVMLPLALKFAAQFGSEAIKNQFAIDEYMSIIISVMLAAGVVFELPMVSFFLSKLGILKPSFMQKYRRHAIIVILILAAFLTPGADPVSQIILAAPLVVLYEISIFISKISQRKS
jgi:sec-independent protein translocase protein TatC